MDELYELKEMLCKELKEYGTKGKLDVGGLDIVDKLSHSIKNIDKIIEKYEEEGYSEEGGSYAYNRGGSYRGGSYDGRRGGSYEGGRGGSYARGRGRNARRDSMGRYSREDGYSSAEDDMDDLVMELKEMAHELPPEKKTEVQRFIKKIEMM